MNPTAAVAKSEVIGAYNITIVTFYSYAVFRERSQVLFLHTGTLLLHLRRRLL